MCASITISTPCIYYDYYKECARFTRTLFGGLLHAGCYTLEMVIQWISVHQIFPPLRMLSKFIMLSAGKGRSLICIRLAINHAARAKIQCCCSYSRGNLASTEVIIAVVTRLTEAKFSSLFRLGRQLLAGTCKCHSYSSRTS